LYFSRLKSVEVPLIEYNIFLQVSSASESEKKEAADLRMALEQQMDQLRIAHQQQVASLRDEIAEKQQLINDIRE